MMSYHLDLRERVVAFIDGGATQAEASRIFNISTRTIYRWLQRDDLRPCARKRYQSKLSQDAILAHVREHPDALLRERAAHFGVSPSGIWRALKRHAITKKND